MNTANLLKHNNELRLQLNEENKKYYEELLFACRMKNTAKNESALEIQLLEILQDLILYQKQGKSFTDVFGNDINKLSSSIIAELPKENKIKIFRFSLVYLLILIISSLAPSIFSRTIQILTILSIVVLVLGSLICLYLIIYKKTDKNKWFIYFLSLIIFEVSFGLIPILDKLKIIPECLSLEVTVSTNFLYFYGIFSALSYIYIFLTFKKYYSKKI